MKPLQFVATMMLLCTTTFAIAQRASLTEGNLGALKGVKKLNVKYEYENMTVGKMSEKEYVNDKKEKLNGKDPGSGDRWAKAWVDDRARRFQPRFEEEFNNVCDVITVGNYPAEKYTMVFKTVFTEPGFNIGITRKNAYVDGEVWIIETATQKVIAKLEIPDCPGRTAFGTDFDNGLRLQEAYAMAGKGLAKFFDKNVD